MNRKSGLWIAVWLVLVVITGMLAFGHAPGYRSWQGWGRMGGWPDHTRADNASRWHGMGPGMMRGGGSGYGDTPVSPGMPGPYGGMLPGMGFGGMMGGGAYMMPFFLPDLTSEQAQKITPLLGESAERNRSFMQQRWEGQARLNRLYAADKRDWDAIRTATRTLLDLQRQEMDAAIDLQQKIDGVLTDSQRQEMANSWRNTRRSGPQ
jgi:Spy/CpxP family protein refolding chaperone